MTYTHSSRNAKKPLGKQSIFLILGGLLLLIVALFFYYQSDPQRYKRLTAQIIEESFANDSLSLHFYLNDPAAYGIKETITSLPNYNANERENDLGKLRSQIQQLKDIDPYSLPLSEQQTYQLLLQYLQSELELATYPYFYEPLSPSVGMQTQLPILLSEYRFSDSDDVITYFELLAKIPSYYDSLYIYEREKAGAGMFMTNESCRKVIEQLQTMGNKTSIADNTHFLCTSFQNRIQELIDAGEITLEEGVDLCKQNQSILYDAYATANSNLANNLLLLFDSATIDGGLCNYENGREYYKLLLKRSTGSSKSIPDIRELLQNNFMDTYQSVCLTSSQVSQDKNTINLPYATPEEMLAVLSKYMEQDFPPFPESSDAVTYTVKPVSEHLSSYTSPAYYMIPPIDLITNNSIYINYSRSPSSLTLFTTLAHEGYPGHLYQTVYFYTNLMNTNAKSIRPLLHYGGYVEGYATYAENYAYDYAFRDCNSEYIKVSQYMRNLQLCMYCMMDLAIHYDGMTREESLETLQSFGITDTSVANDVYSYITNEPTTYLKYYLGYLEILECKELAQKEWGELYSDYSFHQFFLEFGPADFESIKKAIPSWNGLAR